MTIGKFSNIKFYMLKVKRLLFTHIVYYAPWISKKLIPRQIWSTYEFFLCETELLLFGVLCLCINPLTPFTGIYIYIYIYTHRCHRQTWSARRCVGGPWTCAPAPRTRTPTPSPTCRCCLWRTSSVSSAGQGSCECGPETSVVLWFIQVQPFNTVSEFSKDFFIISTFNLNLRKTLLLIHPFNWIVKNEWE